MSFYLAISKKVKIHLQKFKATCYWYLEVLCFRITQQ